MGKFEDKEERLKILKQLNRVLEGMLDVDREYMSGACMEIVNIMENTDDPLLFRAHAEGSPFTKRKKMGSKFCSC